MNYVNWKVNYMQFKVGDKLLLDVPKVKGKIIEELDLNLFQVKWEDRSRPTRYSADFLNKYTKVLCASKDYEAQECCIEEKEPEKVEETLGKGLRYDSGKVRLELVPPSLIWAVGRVLTEGAKKYADRNWELGMAYTKPYACLMRHMTKWFNREPNDHETNLSHLYHAAANIAMLIEYEEKNLEELDDRPEGLRKSLEGK